MSARLPLAWVLVLFLVAPAPSSAQDTTQPPTPAAADRPGCALHPSPDCRFFGITEIGLALGPDTRPHEWWESDRAVVGEGMLSGGVMKNATARDAFGGFWFLALDGDGGAATGPGARYRRWFGARRSLDAGAGVAIAGSAEAEQGSIFGHVRYNPKPWLGLGIRPEQLRTSRVTCVRLQCSMQDESTFRLMAGADIAGKPGVVGLGGYGVAVGVVLVFLLIACNCT